MHHKTIKMPCESTSTHERHLQFLLKEIYKNTIIFKTRFTGSFFKERELQCCLKKGTTCYGIHFTYLRGSLI